MDSWGSLGVWNEVVTFSTPAFERALRPRGVASHCTPHQQTGCLRRHAIDLKTRNATPLRTAPWSCATCRYVASVDAYGDGCRTKPRYLWHTTLGREASGSETSSQLACYFHQRLPTTYEPVGQMGSARRT